MATDPDNQRDRSAAPDRSAITDTPSGTRRWSPTTMIAFALFVFVPAVVTVSGVARSDTRAGPESLVFDGADDDLPDTAQGSDPGADPAAAGSGGRSSGVERWLNERVPGREIAAEFERTTTRILDDDYARSVADAPDVLMGDDGWLFYRPSALQPCFTPEEEAMYAEEIRRSIELVASTGRRLVVSIAPDKETIVPERLGEIEASCVAPNHSVVERLAAAFPEVIDLAEVVGGESHALQLDTHWSPEGAMAAAEAVVEAITPGAWDRPQLEYRVIDRPGDLDRLVGYDHTETVNLIEMTDPSVTERERVETAVSDRPLVTTRSERPGVVDLDVMFVHDSFGGEILEADRSRYAPGFAVDYIRPWFATVGNVRAEGHTISTVAQQPAEASVVAADVIATLFVQRAMRMRFGFGMLSGPLAVALADDIGRTDLTAGTAAPSDGVILAGDVATLEAVSDPAAGPIFATTGGFARSVHTGASVPADATFIG